MNGAVARVTLATTCDLDSTLGAAVARDAGEELLDAAPVGTGSVLDRAIGGDAAGNEPEGRGDNKEYRQSRQEPEPEQSNYETVAQTDAQTDDQTEDQTEDQTADQTADQTDEQVILLGTGFSAAPEPADQPDEQSRAEHVPRTGQAKG